MVNNFYFKFIILNVVDFWVDKYMLWKTQNTPDRTVLFNKKNNSGNMPPDPHSTSVKPHCYRATLSVWYVILYFGGFGEKLN